LHTANLNHSQQFWDCNSNTAYLNCNIPTCHNDIYNISYEMNYDLYKSEQNYLNVSLNITTINNFVVIFNGPFNYNGENIIEIKNYKIVFDYNSTIHNIERFGNYLYINFNNCNLNETIYNFIISYIL